MTQALELVCALARAGRAPPNWKQTLWKLDDVRRRLPLESFWGIICLCDTVNAEVQVCGQGYMRPEHYVSEEIGMVFSKHFSLLWPDFKTKEGQKMAHPTAFLLATLGGFPGYNSPPSPNPTAFSDSHVQWKKTIKLLSPGKEDEEIHVTTEMAPFT